MQHPGARGDPKASVDLGVMQPPGVSRTCGCKQGPCGKWGPQGLVGTLGQAGTWPSCHPITDGDPRTRGVPGESRDQRGPRGCRGVTGPPQCSLHGGAGGSLWSPWGCPLPRAMGWHWPVLLVVASVLQPPSTDVAPAEPVPGVVALVVPGSQRESRRESRRESPLLAPGAGVAEPGGEPGDKGWQWPAVLSQRAPMGGFWGAPGPWGDTERPSPWCHHGQAGLAWLHGAALPGPHAEPPNSAHGFWGVPASQSSSGGIGVLLCVQGGTGGVLPGPCPAPTCSLPVPCPSRQSGCATSSRVAGNHPKVCTRMSWSGAFPPRAVGTCRRLSPIPTSFPFLSRCSQHLPAWILLGKILLDVPAWVLCVCGVALGRYQGLGGHPGSSMGHSGWISWMKVASKAGGVHPPPPAPTPLWHLHSSHQECSSGLTCFPGGWKRGCDSSAGHGTQHLGIPKMGDTIWDPPSHPG